MNNLKSSELQQRITVRIQCNGETGTGVLAMPENGAYIYILTAKHVLLGKDFKIPLIKTGIVIDNILSGAHKFLSYQVQETDDVLISDRNEDDFAIIVINNNTVFDMNTIKQAVYINDEHSLLDCSVRGFPKLIHSKENRSFKGRFEEFIPGNPKHFRVLSTQPLDTPFADAQENVQGLSGGPVFFINEDTSLLLGIVTEYVPINCFLCIRIGYVNTLLEQKRYPLLAIKSFHEEEKGSQDFHYNPNLGNQQNFKELIEGRYRQFARLLAHGCGGISKSSYAVSQDGKVYGWGENVNVQSESDISYCATPVNISDYGSLVGKTILKVASGRNHTLAVDLDGKVYAWGGNYGELPIEVEGLSGIKDITVGDSHFMALKIDGIIYVRGNGGYGQLGNGHFDLGHYHIPSRSMPVGSLSDITAISAGANHCLAVKSDGTVYAWGDDSYGQLGNDYNHPNGHYSANLNASAKPQRINNLSEIISVSAGANHSLALKANGTVFTWGSDNYANSKVPVQVNNLTGIVAIAAGVSHSLALKVDGNVFIWGGEGEGQDGSVTFNGRLEPKQVEELSDVVAIAGGFFHSLACKLDGTVYAWGYNQFGQLRNGTTTNSNEPILVSIPLKAEIETISLPSNVFYVGQKDIIVGFTTESITMENYDQRDKYIAQLSNSTGSFSSPVTIGTGVSYSGYFWQISCTIPANTPFGTGYRIRVINSKTNVLGIDNGNNLTIYASRASINWQVLEDFERPNPWPWFPWKSPLLSGQLSTSAAVSGNYGMVGVDWFYRDDVALGKPGDRISMWAKDWACLGFFAGQHGTQYFALGGNEISFHGIPGYVWHPYRMVVPAEFISLPDKWYRLEVTFTGEGLEGRVYDSDGVKELACLRSKNINIGSGGSGISMRGDFIDEITYYLAPR
ncbi:RCC1 domain-containing protein [Adhaeribacter rhizoryzae]|uniref:RCC1-like domain-containing protein n=1 Tax=Adhaeribacter rhizoryzae TaxID=2607907 RepID=A0A5M6DAD7_9BACT|nr:hypothetical protein [Adhaeribacter rhizoryzae]KAA5542949.1 hypothetical protein F0145_17570 [Adhaeribacter rhizoryzae]